MENGKKPLERFGLFFVAAILVVGGLLTLSPSPYAFFNNAFAAVTSTYTATVSSTVIIGNATPVVASVILNSGSAIVLTANTTTQVSVNATILDFNGCNDLTGGSSTVLLFRAGITSSTCLTTTNNLNCYLSSAFTASSTCSVGQQNTTTTFNVWYFADSTEKTIATSTYPNDSWTAYVIVRDANNTKGGASSTHVDLNVLTALNVTTSSINYGTVGASSTTGGTNQVTTSTNAGNATTTLKIHAVQTLVSGINSIATTSQRYATTTFTVGGSEQQLQQTATAIPNLTLTNPTSTNNVFGPVFWGLTVPNNTPTGTYSGQSMFTAIWAP